MRELIRRLLWLLPTLFAVSLIAFGLLAKTLGSSGFSEPVRSLPVFFNPNPIGGVDRVAALGERIAEPQAEAGAFDPKAAAEELNRIGAAGLPRLMPYLDSLPPEARQRVLTALLPLARRMRIVGPEVPSGEELQTLWARYWADHSIDFRLALVERAVQRLIRRPSPARRLDLIELDTYALGPVLKALWNTDDPRAQAELTRIAQQITGRGKRISEEMPEAARREAIGDWYRFLNENRSSFVSYEGGDRLFAMFQETQFGRFVAEWLGPFGWIRAGVSGALLLGSAWISGWLVLSGLFGGYAVGPVLAAAAAAQKAPRLRAGIVWLCLLLATVPVAFIASWLGQSGARGLWLPMGVMFVAGAGAVCLQQYQATRDALSQDYVQTERAFGASRWRAALIALRTTGLISAVHLASQGSRLFAATCVVEIAFSLPGLGARTILAIRDYDVGWLVATAVVSTLFAGGLQIVSSLLLKRLLNFATERPEF